MRKSPSVLFSKICRTLPPYKNMESDNLYCLERVRFLHRRKDLTTRLQIARTLRLLDDEDLKCAMWILAESGGRGVAKYIYPFMSHRSPDVRRRASDALTRGSEEDLARLIAIAQTGQSLESACAVQALAWWQSINPRKALASVVDCMVHRFQNVRLVAFSNVDMSEIYLEDLQQDDPIYRSLVANSLVGLRDTHQRIQEQAKCTLLEVVKPSDCAQVFSKLQKMKNSKTARELVDAIRRGRLDER